MTSAEAARGLFVTFEGGDGAGKTTQAALLQEWLEASGRSVVRTREPGGTEVGVLVRDIVLHHRGEVAPRAEALLYAADRAHHVETVVRPALARGDVVIQDRYLDSSVAYQGAGRVLGPREVRDLSLWATGGLLPDVTVLLDLDPATARSRLDADDKPFDRLESEKSAFHERVRAEFLALAGAEPERFLVLDASRPVDELATIVRERVAASLAR
ncbi:dTMP kinase [Microbacterium sp. CJ88]|uniref:dTMP kinase n=1 Tax=Microbacterium sp. CJ88 TaxID=3445672 RepID=UPI003F65F0BF